MVKLLALIVNKGLNVQLASLVVKSLALIVNKGLKIQLGFSSGQVTCLNCKQGVEGSAGTSPVVKSLALIVNKGLKVQLGLLQWLSHLP